MPACCCETAATDERKKDHNCKKDMKTIACCNTSQWPQVLITLVSLWSVRVVVVFFQYVALTTTRLNSFYGDREDS